MATATTELEVVISAKDEASGKLKNIGASAAEIGKTFAVAGAAIVGAMGYAVKQATDAQTTIAGLDATLRTMGEGALKNKDAILQAADAAVRLGFDDETAAASIGRLYQRTGDLNQAIKLNALAMDIAAAKHIDLDTASKAVNMALTGQGRLFKELGIATKDAGEPMELLAEAQAKVAGQAQAFASTAAGQMAVLKESFNNVAQGIGEVLLPIIQQVMTQVQPVIQGIIDWTKENPKLTQTIVLAVAALGGLLAVLAPVMLIVSAISAPVIAAGVAIGALGYAIFLLIQNWEQVKIALAPFIVQLQELWRTAVELLKPAFDILIATLLQLWDKFKVLWELLQPILIPVLKWLGIFLGATLVAAIAAAIVALTLIAKMIETLIDWFKTLVDWLTNVAYWFMTTLPEAIKHFQAVWASSWDAIKEKISSVVDYIQSRIDAVINAWNKAQSLVSAPISAAVSNVKSAVSSVVSKVTGKKAGGGGVEAGNAYLVGERGAELFTPMSNGFITPNNALAGAGGNITVNINGGTYLSERVAIQIGDMIVDRLKMVSKIRV